MTEESPSTTIALVPPSLVPLAPLPPTDRETYISDTAMELQKTGGRPDSTGAFVFFHLGPEWVDRITEIMGRVGSAGEQLAIALATNRTRAGGPPLTRPGWMCSSRRWRCGRRQR